MKAICLMILMFAAVEASAMREADPSYDCTPAEVEALQKGLSAVEKSQDSWMRNLAQRANAILLEGESMRCYHMESSSEFHLLSHSGSVKIVMDGHDGGIEDIKPLAGE